MRKILHIVLVWALLAPAATLWAMPKKDRKAAKKMLEDRVLYMRIDAPCATGRHPYGVYKRPLVEVSPEGSTADTDTMMTASWWHADSTYWGIRINDAVELDEVEFETDDAEVDIELEGVGEAEDSSTAIRFVGIRSLADFQAAFDHAFASVPLQEEHDDWSAEIKQAIHDRKLLDGMSKRQVFYITGTPDRFEQMEEDGQKIEIWHLRQDKGMKTGYLMAKVGESTGFPAQIRFEEGRLVGTVARGDDSEFSVD